MNTRKSLSLREIANATRRASAPAALTLAAILALSLVAWRSASIAKPASRVQPVWKMDLPFPGLPLGSVLEDVSSDGAMLLRHGRYTLVVWRPGAIKPIAKVELPAWPKRGQQLWASTECKFGPSGKRIVCAHGPWLALVDVSTEKVIRRVTGTQDFSGLSWGDWDVQISKKMDRNMLPSSPTVLGMNPKDGRVAVAYNTLKNPKILLFSADLRTRLADWQPAKYIESLFWSPDGNRLGVLYFNAYEPYDRQGKWTGWHPHRALAGVPDASIFDISSGKELLSFATGDIDAKATFSPDGKLIYVITHFFTGVDWGFGGWAEETLRTFSSSTGKLVRTFKVTGTGVRNNFAISADGGFIAAECTKYTHSNWYYLLRLSENLGGDMTAGFVILDASTGRIIFREKRRMFGDLTGVLPLFFSAEGDLLITEFGQPPSHLVAYSVAH